MEILFSCEKGFSDVYESFYGLTARPFDLTPDPRFLVVTDVHQEALSNLEYAISSRKGITLLVGESGTGKTTIIQAAIEKQSERVHCVHLHNPALTRVEFVEMLAAQFSLSEKARKSKTELLLELEHLLKARRNAGETTVLIVDEAQSLPFELLDEIRLLTNIETTADKLVTLIIAGQPEIAERLNGPAFRQFKQRIALRCSLRPLSLNESVGYIASRIRMAGGVPAQVFTREAVILVYEHSRGIPRLMNVLADNALLGGFAAQQRPIKMQLVRDVCLDFDIQTPPTSIVANPRNSVSPRATRPISASEQHVLDSALSAAARGSRYGIRKN
jgi:general secretion pathway protein A